MLARAQFPPLIDGCGLHLDDGRICVSNNAAERALRGIALGRRSWLFCGSDRGRQRAAVMESLIVTAKVNDVDPQAWLADVLARIAPHPAQRLADLLPWTWAAAPARPSGRLSLPTISGRQPTRPTAPRRMLTEQFRERASEPIRSYDGERVAFASIVQQR